MISSAFERNVTTDPNCIGYFGTSLQVVKYILEQGIIPAGNMGILPEPSTPSLVHPWGGFVLTPAVTDSKFVLGDYLC